MELRKRQEALEEEWLDEHASKSSQTKGRLRPEVPCDIRTEFQRDRDRILHCKAFRRMKHKTQVFISPEGDHYRTRLTHTLEVSQIARTISRALRFNEDLTEAIALGHDLGHTPFGHAGENVLDALCKDGFEHCAQSIRVVERLEKNGRGLNLTWEVKDGILNHRTAGHPHTLEGCVVQLSDKIAYINHDIDDAIRAGVLKENEIPLELQEVIGRTASARINSMIRDTISHSSGEKGIQNSPEMKQAMGDLRKFMFQKVYTDERAVTEGRKVDRLLRDLFSYFMEHPEEMQQEFLCLMEEGETVERTVCDFIACMTDRYAVALYHKLFIPSSWNIY